MAGHQLRRKLSIKFFVFSFVLFCLVFLQNSRYLFWSCIVGSFIVTRPENPFRRKQEAKDANVRARCFALFFSSSSIYLLFLLFLVCVCGVCPMYPVLCALCVLGRWWWLPMICFYCRDLFCFHLILLNASAAEWQFRLPIQVRCVWTPSLTAIYFA